MSYGAGVAAGAKEQVQAGGRQVWTFEDRPKVDASVAALRLDALKLAHQTLAQTGDEYTPDDVVAAAGKYMVFVSTTSVQELTEAVEKIMVDNLEQITKFIYGVGR